MTTMASHVAMGRTLITWKSLVLLSLISSPVFTKIVAGEETSDISDYDRQFGNPKYYYDGLVAAKQGRDKEDEEDNEEEEDDEEEPDIYSMTDEELLEYVTPLDEQELMEQSYNAATDALFARIERNQVIQHQTQTKISVENTASFGEFLDAGTGPHSLKWIASLVHRQKLISSLVDDDEDYDIGEEISEEGLLVEGNECDPLFYDNSLLKTDEPTDGEDIEINRPSSCISPVTITNYTAVTADEGMRKAVLETAAKFSIVPESNVGEILIGNWEDPTFLAHRKFDTILMDYLIGAMDGYSPYYQDVIFKRLLQHLKPGGRMYIVGLQPVPDYMDGPGDVFCRITKVRDACILLAGDRCYREFPLDWVLRHLERDGLKVVDYTSFGIRQSANAMIEQIDTARRKLEHFATEGLADEMGELLNGLEEEVWEIAGERPVEVGFDYVVTAELPKDWYKKVGGNPKKEDGSDEL